MWFGLTWSLELYQQTNAKLWRQGQTTGTVVIQHIVTKGTIDEHILRALERKDGTQSVLIDAVKATLWEDTTMYKNHEEYSDPTAGTALGHITGEENRKKRAARRKAQRKKNRLTINTGRNPAIVERSDLSPWLHTVIQHRCSAGAVCDGDTGENTHSITFVILPNSNCILLY